MTQLSNEQQAAIVAAAEKLVRCKGRYHSEQNYRALAALFGVTVPDLPPLADDAQEPVTPDHMTLIDKGRLSMLEDSHRTLLDYRADNLWYWQGDEDDQPELLTCPVMMSADTLRDLLAKSAPQPVAVPDLRPDWMINEFSAGWNSCRAAMLNTEPVSQPYTLPDDTKRMDWLVSKTVNVREPMVYGSHSLFWSQAITDENDEYHATKLREQIDAAMAEEQAAAPQEPTK